jgi:hypothetical protein
VRKRRFCSGPRERLLLVGTSVALARDLHERRQELGGKIAGFIDTDADRAGESLINPGKCLAGQFDEMAAYAHASGFTYARWMVTHELSYLGATRRPRVPDGNLGRRRISEGRRVHFVRVLN